MTTKKFLSELTIFLNKKYLKFQQIDPQNITGFSIKKKVSKGVETRRYSIVFYVKKKRKRMDSKYCIPPVLLVKCSDGTIRKVKTDVVETGVFKTHVGIASAIRKRNASSGGSIGLFVKDDFGKVYALTCYHVLGAHLISNGDYSFNKSGSLTNYDVEILREAGNSVVGTFCAGRISTQIDAALVYLPSESIDQLSINRINGDPITNYVGRNYHNRIVRSYGYWNYNKLAKVDSISGVVLNDLTGYNLTGLIELSKVVSRPGDSGGLLMLDNPFMPIGIIIGANKLHTYAVPLEKILSHFTLKII